MIFMHQPVTNQNLGTCLRYLHTKFLGSPKTFQEAPRKLQKFSGQKSRNNFVGILEETVISEGHFEIK